MGWYQVAVLGLLIFFAGWVIEDRLEQLIGGLAGLRSDLKDVAEDIKTTIELKD